MASPTFPRTQVLENLSREFGIPYNLSSRAQTLEQDPPLFLPTLGTEIEVPWRVLIEDHEEWFTEPYSAFSPTKKQAFDDYCTKREKELFPLYDATVAAGVPRGRERFHEFANAPVAYYETLAEEVRLLFAAGLIPEDENLSLHLTIGDLRRTKDAGLLTCLVQLLGGSNPYRLTLPRKVSKRWDVKSVVGGIKERSEQYLEMGRKQAIEIRTLVAQSSGQIRETLQNAQSLAYGVLAKEANLEGDFAREAKERWGQVATDTANFLKDHGLNTWWDRPSESKTQWEKFAALYGAPETQELLFQARKEIRVLEQLFLGESEESVRQEPRRGPRAMEWYRT